MLSDIWPSNEEIAQAVSASVTPEMFETQYGSCFDSNETWNKIAVTGGDLYEWSEQSTYIQEPPFLVDITPEVSPIQPVKAARVLALLGDSVTTDHISPAGAIAQESPAGTSWSIMALSQRALTVMVRDVVTIV